MTVSTNLAAAKAWGYVVAVLGVAVVTGFLKLFGSHVNSVTVALALLLVVLFVATAWGSRQAILASLVGVVCFNFFLPPIGTLDISAPDNWTALAVFLVTAVTVGQLSARARQRAQEAERARQQVEGLYRELQESFEQASRAKAVEQSERLKSALLDAVTHDLRTPLTSIKASVTTLLEHASGSGANLGAEGQKEMLEVINEESDRLDRFIEDLMELAKIEAGELRPQKQWGSVEEIVTAALKRAENLTRHHQVKVQLDAELPAVRVDERAVAEVIYNLVENAAKFAPSGTEIVLEARAGVDDNVSISVTDAGPGIPKELRERVFDKFFRAIRDGDSTGARSPGTGMGLAIARGIVEAHEGRIWIEDSRLGVGTRVVITLPTGDRDAN
jgi:K+-sensing histidine kinase KdpD